MKKYFLVIFSIIFFSCNNEKNNSAVSDSKSTEPSQNITIIVKNPLKKEIFFDWSSLLDASTQPYEATSAHDTILIKSNIPVKLNSSDMIRSGKIFRLYSILFCYIQTIPYFSKSLNQSPSFLVNLTKEIKSFHFSFISESNLGIMKVGLFQYPSVMITQR